MSLPHTHTHARVHVHCLNPSFKYSNTRIRIRLHVHAHTLTSEVCFELICSTDHGPHYTYLEPDRFLPLLLFLLVLCCSPSLSVLLIHLSLQLSSSPLSLSLSPFSLSLFCPFPPFLASAAASLLRHMSRELSAAFKGLCVQPFFPLIWFPQNTFP